MWNRDILPVIEDRIERAEQQIRSYLAIHDLAKARLGVYEVELVDEAIRITRLPTDDWRQMPLPQVESLGRRGSGEVFTHQEAEPASLR